jgi:RiboL-PSP-HEPN
MPSKALIKFENSMMKDVDRIIDTHTNLLTGAKGKKALGHLTRGGVLLLCAAWELYIEEILIEAVSVCRDRANGPNELPKSVQKAIAKHVADSKHELKALALAGDGWKVMYLEIANEAVVSLNTPKKHNVDQLFLSLVGVPEISSCWSKGAAAINDFVQARGDVAHRGSDSGYIKMSKLRDVYKSNVCLSAVETDNKVTTFIRDTFNPKSYPWNRRNL